MTDPVGAEDLAAVERCREAYDKIRAELGRLIVGQAGLIEQVLVALLGRGHVFLEAVPGLAKTLLVSLLAEAAQLSFKRIQFTPDLLPGDVTGTEVLQADPETGQRHYRFLPGPLFANLLLADEINRTPPKIQALVLEAMHQRQVSVAGQARPLPVPFFVLATQSPWEQEGTYPLLQAQLDHFALYVKTDYPSGPDEWEIARRVTGSHPGPAAPLVSSREVISFQDLVVRLPVSDQVLGYAWALIRASRPGTEEAPEFVHRWVACGAGPRGLLALVTSAKARAVLHGRYQATAADVQALVKPALRHRIVGNHAAEANNLTSDKLIGMLLEAVPAEANYPKP